MFAFILGPPLGGGLENTNSSIYNTCFAIAIFVSFYCVVYLISSRYIKKTISNPYLLSPDVQTISKKELSAMRNKKQDELGWIINELADE